MATVRAYAMANYICHELLFTAKEYITCIYQHRGYQGQLLYEKNFASVIYSASKGRIIHTLHFMYTEGAMHVLFSFISCEYKCINKNFHIVHMEYQLQPEVKCLSFRMCRTFLCNSQPTVDVFPRVVYDGSPIPCKEE